MPQLALPSVLERQAWQAPATADDFAEVSAFVVSAVEPGAVASRTALVSRLLAMRGYSRAELLLVAQEAPFRNHFGPHVKPDVVDAIVQESRSLRAMLTREVSSDELAALCAAQPDLNPPDEHFACSGFDDRNRARWRYAPEVARRAKVQGLHPAPEGVPTPSTPPATWLPAAGDGSNQ